MKTAIGLFWAGLIAITGSAGAATFTVDIEGDTIDPLPGNGFCSVLNQPGPGPCALRAAIIEANALPGADTIFLTAGQTYALTRSGNDDAALVGDLDITDDVTIIFFASGERPVVDANGVGRAFHIVSGNATLFGFDITEGDAVGEVSPIGGALLVGPMAGLVQLSLLHLHDNRADAGGAIYNDGDDTAVSGSEIYANRVSDPFVVSGGAAIYNRGNLIVDHSSIRQNTTVSGDAATAITSLTSEARTLTIVNSTISANRIGVSSAQASPLFVRNATIAGNSQFGIQVTGMGGHFQMRNSIVAGNGSADCSLSTDATLNLDGYNMDSDNTCELDAGFSNYPGVEPYLTPLAYHGGVTQVSWPLSISPLLENGHFLIGGLGCEEDDQHFTDRPIDFDGNGNARCDIGAVELSDDVIFFDPYELL